jgi:hypothetical protein
MFLGGRQPRDGASWRPPKWGGLLEQGQAPTQVPTMDIRRQKSKKKTRNHFYSRYGDATLLLGFPCKLQQGFPAANPRARSPSGGASADCPPPVESRACS